MKINWKGNLIALGVILFVAGAYFLAHHDDFTSQDASYITAKASDNSPDIVTEDVNGNILTGDQVDSTTTNNDSPFVDDSYMNTPVENSDDSAADAPKTEPKIGDPWQRVVKSSWGSPEDKTTTKDQYGTTELWLYSGGRSLFFEDGILESITE